MPLKGATMMHSKSPLRLADAYPLVKDALRITPRPTIGIVELKRRWNAHPNLTVLHDPTPFILSRADALAVERSLAELTDTPSTGGLIERPLFSIKHGDRISRVRVGAIGTEHGRTAVNLETAPSYVETRDEAKRSSGRIVWGHIHPPGYGPIPSVVSDHPSHTFGTDYHVLTQLQPVQGRLDAGVHMIIAEDNTNPDRLLRGRPTLGIWTADKNGIVKIHPWRISD